MPQCAVCDQALQVEQKTCHVCGSSVTIASSPPAPSPTTTMPDTSQRPSIPSDATPATGVEVDRECPACDRTFSADYDDEFCPCGTELQERTPTDGSSDESGSPLTSATSETSTSPSSVPSSLNSADESRPPVGTACLVLYSDSKPRTPIRYFPIVKDVLLIGRLDPLRGDFPDIDLGSLVEESLSRRVSRRHAEVLRARNTQTLSLRPLPGNTGTHVGKELATPGQTYPLVDGTPIVLGGVIWMKFETIKAELK